MANKPEIKDAEVVEIDKDIATAEEIPEVKQKGLKAWFKRNWKKVAGGAAIAGGVATIVALGMRKHHSAVEQSEPDFEEAVEQLRKYLEAGGELVSEELSIDDTSEAKETAE